MLNEDKTWLVNEEMCKKKENKFATKPFRVRMSFMEPDGSLPCSQEPATDPYSEIHQASQSPSSTLVLETNLKLSKQNGNYVHQQL
jgi:hypothetical protein